MPQNVIHYAAPVGFIRNFEPAQERNLVNEAFQTNEILQKISNLNLNIDNISIIINELPLDLFVSFVTDWETIRIGNSVGEFKIGENIRDPTNTIIFYSGVDPQNPPARPVIAKKVYTNKTKANKDYFEYEGYKFSKELDVFQQFKLLSKGYDYFIRYNPSYEYKEKFSLDDKEIIEIVLFELANYYAVEELEKTLNKKYDSEKDNDLYKSLLDKHINKIISFKKNKND